MGAPKAGLEWHGSTLLRRAVGIVGRGCGGPVVVVRAPGQVLPPLPSGVRVAEDAREGRGPLEGLLAGMDAVGARIAYVASTDAPLLHPAFVAAVLAALDEDHDVALPEVAGHRQPLAAAYRTALRPVLHELVAADRLRPAALFEVCRVRRPAHLPHADASVLNLNTPADYERARALPEPSVTVNGVAARAATLARAGLPPGATASIAPGHASVDPEEPLAEGDVVRF